MTAEPIRIGHFALPLPLHQGFDYRLPAGVPLQPGMRCRLPFGSGSKVGLLLSLREENTPRDDLKPIEACLDEQPLLSAELMELARWAADYYLQPIGEVLFLCLPKALRKGQPAQDTRVTVWRPLPADEADLQALARKAPKQHALYLALLDEPEGMSAQRLREQAGGWRNAMRGLIGKGLAEAVQGEDLNWPQQEAEFPPLTAEQQAVVDAIAPRLDRFGSHLIQGVTGSGKTEIYLSLMRQVIDAGRQVILLAPEIGLTPQLVDRFRRRLGRPVLLSHSGQGDTERYRNWDRFRRGVAPVLIGTRSALFSDCPDLGLIVVDEEHDASYRQQDGVRYHARDVAIRRAQQLGIPVILGSATPSSETLYNLRRAHAERHWLRQRVGGGQPPRIELLDVSQVKPVCGCSPRLLQAVESHLEAGGQALLFLNRRGYAPVVMCHECGWQAQCHQCDARMTLHQSINRLVCHHCGSQQPMPPVCPGCGEGEIRHHGVGTEQLEGFLAERFAGTPVIRVDRDTVSASRSLASRLEGLRDGRPAILVGTQMLAKGHDYPNISLVGVLDADQALYSSFYRASERLIQTVLQVAGRAGRADRPGQALLQTAFPQHPLMQGLTMQDYDALMQPILQERELLGFPPAARAITLQVDARTLEASLQRLQQFRQMLDEAGLPEGVRRIGPIPALMTRRIGRYRAQLSLLAPDVTRLRQALRPLMPLLLKPPNRSDSRLTIEVDPPDL